MTDYTKMTASEMLQEIGDDAQKWAAAFCQTAEKLGHHGIDEGWMIGWFANAIEQSTAVRASRTPAPEGEVVAWRWRQRSGAGGWAVSLDDMGDGPDLICEPLYASPVVPVSREEVAREKVLDELDRAWLHGRWDHPWERQKAADAILAALGTKATDTGREDETDGPGGQGGGNLTEVY